MFGNSVIYMRATPSIRNAAMNLLARREHSTYELEQKLLKRFEDIQTIREAIIKLQNDGLQCDQRFAEHYLQARANKGFGKLKIQQELKQKGVADDDISNAFAKHNIDWFAVLFNQYEKKYGQLAPASLEQKARCQRFLLSRGFSFEQLSNLWRELD